MNLLFLEAAALLQPCCKILQLGILLSTLLDINIVPILLKPLEHGAHIWHGDLHNRAYSTKRRWHIKAHGPLKNHKSLLKIQFVARNANTLPRILLRLQQSSSSEVANIA